MEGRLVIRNGIVPGAGAGGEATVVVSGRTVAEVAPAGRAVPSLPGDWDVDAGGRLVVAGLVDGHAHLGIGGLLRLAGLPGRPPPTVADLRVAVRSRLEERATPELLEPLVRAGALASLRSGVTCVLDAFRGRPGLATELLAAEERGLSVIGLRAVVAYGARGTRGGEAGGADEVRAAAEFAGRVAGHPRLRGAIGIAGLADASEELLSAAAEHAPRSGLHACIGEDESDLAHAFARWGRRPVEALGQRGLLGPRALVAHAGTAVHAEAALLAEKGATLAVSPRAATFFGAPIPPLGRFAEMGVRIVFGTDGLFSDPAAEAVAALAMLRHAERSATTAQELVGRVAWPAAAGFVSACFGERAGAVAPGALADLVILDWRPPFPIPEAPDGDLAVLWAGSPAAWVIVDGEVRLREGRLLGGDEREIAARAREAAAKLLA